MKSSKPVVARDETTNRGNDTKKSNSKSTGRAVLEDVFPNSFLTKPQQFAPLVQGAQFVYEDSLIFIHGLYNGKPVSEFITGMKYRCETYLKVRKCSTFAICFDVEKHIPIRKGSEQHKRDNSKRKKTEGMPIGLHQYESWKFIDFQNICYQNILPEDLEVGLADRAGFRKWLIAWLVCQWIDKSNEPQYRIDVPLGCQVIISGHNLQDDELKIEEDCPFSIDSDGNIKSLTNLKNDWGEAESAILFYIDQLSPSEPCITLSKDTDLILGYTPYTENQQSAKIFIQHKPRFDQEAYISCEQLWKDITDHFRRKAIRFPVRTLMLAYAAGGGDYTDGIPGTSNKSYVNAMLYYSHRIGNLIREDMTLNPQAFINLNVIAFVLSVYAKGKNKPDPETATFSQVYELSHQNYDAKYQMPSMNTLYCRFLHWRTYYTMVFQLGSKEFDLKEKHNELIESAFGPRDPKSKEITKKNIVRLQQLPDDVLMKFVNSEKTFSTVAMCV